MPDRQYRRYAIFWSVLTLGTLSWALVGTVWKARAALSWREIVVALLLLTHMGLYRLLLGRTLLPSQRRLVVYFAVNLGMWAVECWLVPEVWWIVFAYMGQMFGMLSAKIAVSMTLGAGIVFLGNSTGWSLEQVGTTRFSGILGGWLFLVVFFLYINHLIQANRDRGKVITELEAAKKELEAAQQREAELAVLRERERLARDLHDSLGHTLVAFAVQLEAIQRLYRVDPERASVQVDELKALTRASMDALRRSVAGLRAPGLGDSALRPAIQALCMDLGQRAWIEVDCRVDEEADELGLALAEALWRVTQEALTNVEKHAQARQVWVTLRYEPGSVLLRVTDDGVGLSENAESIPNRFGLRGMRERVEGLGGTLALRGDENGTVVAARLPVIVVADQPTVTDSETPPER